VKRKFFGTIYNTYSFFALYANVDNFRFTEKDIPVKVRPEIDRWIISLLNSLVKEVGGCYEHYDLTRAGRAIQDFVTENLSNWYVRLNRKRYWGGDYDQDKIAAYQTLFQCLETVSRLAAPVAPFYMDQLFRDLNITTGRQKYDSVHLAPFPEYDKDLIDKDLEERMDIAQKISSMILGLRRKVSIKVRQPLAKVMIPLPDKDFRMRFEAVKNLVLTEVNVKEVEYIDDTSSVLVKKIKPNFKSLGPRFGKSMKDAANAISALSQKDIASFEASGSHTIYINGAPETLMAEDVEIISEDIPGWQVANEGRLTVALDITVTNELRYEGIAREFVNRIQNIRKENGYDVTDKIKVQIEDHDFVREAVKRHAGYIGSQTLASVVTLESGVTGENVRDVEIDDVIVKVLVNRV
jgi:isoleucyl-tRNA synthetase